MSLKELEETCDLVSGLLQANNHDLGASVGALLPDAEARGNRERRRFGDNQHNTVYLPGPSHEMQVWHVSLMLAEYLADLLGRKVKDGHCGAPGHAPCATMRAEHRFMFEQYRKALEKLVDDVSQLEATL